MDQENLWKVMMINHTEKIGYLQSRDRVQGFGSTVRRWRQENKKLVHTKSKQAHLQELEK